MLLEFDADQRLWQETVRDAVGKQCPPSLVRSVAEDGTEVSDPAVEGLRRAGWTELTDPENAVELAIVLEELGRATDPTPVSRDADSVRAAGRRPVRPAAGPGAAVYSGVSAVPRRRRLGARRHRPLRARRRPRRPPRRGHRRRACSSSTPQQVSHAAQRRCSIPVLHVAEVSFAGVHVADADAAARRRRAGAPRRADGHGDHHGRRLPADPGPGARPRQAAATSSACRSDRSRPFSTRPPTCTSPSNGPARCPTSPR